MLHSGNSPEKIAQLTGIDVEVVNSGLKKLNNFYKSISPGSQASFS